MSHTPTVDHILLAPSELDHNHLVDVVGHAMGRSIDSADLYLQATQEESWSLEDGIVKSGDFSVDRGFGLRVISGEKSGFAFADGIDKTTLLNAADNAKSIVFSGGMQRIALSPPHQAPSLYPGINPLQTLTDQEKVSLLHEMDRYARSLDPRVKQVFVSLSGEYDVMMVLNSHGHLASDIRPLVHLSIAVVVEQGARREKGSAGGGARCGYEWFGSLTVAKSYADKAVRQALLNLEAKPAPAGLMPVVLGPGWPAVLLHEAIGHGLEGDFNRKKTSAFSDRLGEKVATNLCTVVDDGTLAGRRGSLSVDDEGTPTQRTVLIENGILKNYLLDNHNARLLNRQSTGNGRRESYAYRPLPRMTNTCLLPGKSSPEEIIESVDKGLYAVDFSGGQVDITSGKFVFTMSEAYLIENGQVKQPVKGATLIGSGPEVLKQVSMLGNDFSLDSGIGTCGKEGQSVPVGVGQPTLKIDELTVGGSDNREHA